MRPLLALLAMLLTASAGVPSAPVEMSAHCAGHAAAEGDHHGSAPEHQHQGDSHCPAHSCASAAPCTTTPALIRVDDDNHLGTTRRLSPAALIAAQFSSRDIRPTYPPPRLPSA